MADNAIREVLSITGWSQTELGRRIGVHKQTVQDWAQGRRRPNIGVYTDLHRELLEMQMKIDVLIEQLKQGAGAE